MDEDHITLSKITILHLENDTMDRRGSNFISQLLKGISEV